jgi:hypothetical protein
MRVMPWKLIRERVTAVYARRPLAEAADAFLESLWQSFGNGRQGAGEENEVPGKADEGLSTKRVYAQRFLKLLRPWNLLCANVSGVAGGVSSIVHGSSPPDSVSHALGGLALVGPAFVVVEVLAVVIETGLLSQECRGDLVQNVPAYLQCRRS